jgi:hypothetical protein
MGFDCRPATRILGGIALIALGVGCAATALAQRGPIYSCVDATGKKITSDRPIPECTGKPLNSLNADGSLRGVVPPPATTEERERKEAQEREAEAKEMQYKQWVRADRNLMQRYPGKAEHDKARDKALGEVVASVKNLKISLTVLVKERKTLDDEAEFYPPGKLPAKLKSSLDANDASVRGQRDAMQKVLDTEAKINKQYDAELARLQRLWTGTSPGSLGPLLTPEDETPSRAAVKGQGKTATK